MSILTTIYISEYRLFYTFHDRKVIMMSVVYFVRRAGVWLPDLPQCKNKNIKSDKCSYIIVKYTSNRLAATIVSKL